MTRRTTATYQNFAELDQETTGALLRWTLSLADTKHRSGIRISEWVNGGPALEAAVGASAITQDELGHARSLYAMLREFPEAPEGMGAENDLEARQAYFCPRDLHLRWASWLDVIAANVALDRATHIAVTALRSSAFGPLKGRIAKILQEEQFHRIFGDSWLAKLARMGEEKHTRLQASLTRFGKMAITWLGPDDDGDMALLRQQNILGLSPKALRARWLEEVTPLLEKHGFDAPEAQVDWAGWDRSYRDAA